MGQSGLIGATRALRAANNALETRVQRPLLLERCFVGGVVFEVVRQGLRYSVRRAGAEVYATRAFANRVSHNEAQARAGTALQLSVEQELKKPNVAATRSTLMVRR